MSDAETRFHEQWLGMVQPIEGLVVSVPSLVDAQCWKRLPLEARDRLLELCFDLRGAEGLPVLFVAEQICRELPAFLVATVDKFAMLPARPACSSSRALPAPPRASLRRRRQAARPEGEIRLER